MLIFTFCTFCNGCIFTSTYFVTFTYFVILVFFTFARFVLLVLCYSVVKAVDCYSDSRGSVPTVRPGSTIDFLDKFIKYAGLNLDGTGNAEMPGG